MKRMSVVKVMKAIWEWVPPAILAGGIAVLTSACAMSTSDDISELSANADTLPENVIAPLPILQAGAPTPWCACQVLHAPANAYFDNYACGAVYPYAVTHTGGFTCTAGDPACYGPCRLVAQGKDGILGMVTSKTST